MDLHELTYPPILLVAFSAQDERPSASAALFGAVDTQPGLVMLVTHGGQPGFHLVDRSTTVVAASHVSCQRPDLSLELVFAVDQFAAGWSAPSWPSHHLGMVRRCVPSSLRAKVFEGETGVSGRFNSQRHLRCWH